MGGAGPVPVPEGRRRGRAEAAQEARGRDQERLRPPRLGQRRGATWKSWGVGALEAGQRGARPRRRSRRRWPTTPAASAGRWACGRCASGSGRTEEATRYLKVAHRVWAKADAEGLRGDCKSDDGASARRRSPSPASPPVPARTTARASDRLSGRRKPAVSSSRTGGLRPPLRSARPHRRPTMTRFFLCLCLTLALALTLRAADPCVSGHAGRQAAGAVQLPRRHRAAARPADVLRLRAARGEQARRRSCSPAPLSDPLGKLAGEARSRRRGRRRTPATRCG